MYRIEFTHANTPAKIILDPNVFPHWVSRVLFRGLIEDTYEGVVLSATREKMLEDVRALSYKAGSANGKIELAKGTYPTQFVPRYTLTQRIKQAVKHVPTTELAKTEMERVEKEKSNKEEQKFEGKVLKSRGSYTKRGIKKGVELHKERMVARHYRMF